MKLPTYRRIITQDFEEEDQTLVEQLGSNINDGFNVIYGALNKRLSFADNIAASVKTITISVNSSGNPVNSVNAKLDVPNTQVIGCQVIKAENITNPAIYPTSAPFISYTQDGDIIRINNITGLQAGNTYRITFIAIN